MMIQLSIFYADAFNDEAKYNSLQERIPPGTSFCFDPDATFCSWNIVQTECYTNYILEVHKGCHNPDGSQAVDAE